jgi:hypothetical protein
MPNEPKQLEIVGVSPAENVKQITEHDKHAHEQATDLREGSLRAEQELKTREAMQRDHNMFPKGLASDHGKGKARKS